MGPVDRRGPAVADDAVDEQYGTILRAAMEYMATHPSGIKAAMSIASCAKYLERIADHATNIAENVIYMVDGSIIRHGAGK